MASLTASHGLSGIRAMTLEKVYEELSQIATSCVRNRCVAFDVTEPTRGLAISLGGRASLPPWGSAKTIDSRV